MVEGQLFDLVHDGHQLLLLESFLHNLVQHLQQSQSHVIISLTRIRPPT